MIYKKETDTHQTVFKNYKDKVFNINMLQD